MDKKKLAKRLLLGLLVLHALALEVRFDHFEKAVIEVVPQIIRHVQLIEMFMQATPPQEVQN